MTPHQTDSELHAACRVIYHDTKRFYAGKEAALETAALGFSILYGPPLKEPDTFFLGYRPRRWT